MRLQYPQPPGISQITVDWQDPHWHARRAPTRFTSGASRRAADCANRAQAVSAANKRLFRNRDILSRNSDYLRPGIGQTYLARNQTNDGSRKQNPPTDPNPGD